MTADRYPRDSTQFADRRVSKWLAVLGFGVVAVLAVVALSTPSANGYERSAYGAYPLWFWILVMLALFIGQIIILRAALDRYPETANWRVGLVLVGVVQTLLVFMPYVRGYPVYGAADVLTHIGYVRKIETTGGGLTVNVYQNIHQLVLALSYATGIEPMHVINAVSGVISLFVLCALYVLLSSVFDRRRTLMTLPFVVVLIAGPAHMNSSPFSQSILLFPFVFYLFVRAQQTEAPPFRLALAVGVVGLIIYHPLTGLFLILVLLVHYVVLFLFRDDDGPAVPVQVSPVSSKLVMQLSLVTFVAWYYNFAGIFIRFDFVFEQLLGRSSGQSDLTHYSLTVSKYSPPLSDIVAIGLARRGQTAVYLGIGVLFVLTAVWLYVRGRDLETPYLATFALGFCLFSGLGVIFLTTNLIGGYGRPLVFAQFFGAFMSGSLFYHAYFDFGWRRTATTAVSVALVALVVFSVAGLYHSPLSSESNLQVTKHNIDGADWYLENGDESAPIEQLGVGIFRFEDALNGTRSDTLPDVQRRPPDHFNYTVHEMYGEGYNETRYLVVAKRGRIFYPTIYPDYRQFWRFVEADWRRLERDPTVSHVYDNGEFDVYVVASLDDG